MFIRNETNAEVDEQPVAGKHGQTGEDDRRDFRAFSRILKLRERNLHDVKKQMVIDVLFRVERRQRQPGKLRWEFPLLYSFPECARPLDVIVTVVVAATD
jgi:hypothetical protein